MSMKCVNLLPSHRRDAHARAYRLRAWFVGGGAYALLLVAACGLSYAIWGGDQAAIAAQSQRAARQLDEGERILAKLQPELNEAQARLSMIQAIDEQPDWSILLRLLAKSSTDQIVLTACRLDGSGDSAKPRSGRSATTQPGSMNNILTVTGYGRSQASVSHFVLRLEEAKLFDQVSLIRTSREAFGAGDAVAFTIECSLSSGGAP
jgi:Tfp pilus assembly protein PilN